MNGAAPNPAEPHVVYGHVYPQYPQESRQNYTQPSFSQGPNGQPWTDSSRCPPASFRPQNRMPCSCARCAAPPMAPANSSQVNVVMVQGNNSNQRIEIHHRGGSSTFVSSMFSVTGYGNNVTIINNNIYVYHNGVYIYSGSGINGNTRPQNPVVNLSDPAHNTYPAPAVATRPDPAPVPAPVSKTARDNVAVSHAPFAQTPGVQNLGDAIYTAETHQNGPQPLYSDGANVQNWLKAVGSDPISKPPVPAAKPTTPTIKTERMSPQVKYEKTGPVRMVTPPRYRQQKTSSHQVKQASPPIKVEKTGPVRTVTPPRYKQQKVDSLQAKRDEKLAKEKMARKMN